MALPRPLRACKRSAGRPEASSKPRARARSRGSSGSSFCRLLSRPTKDQQGTARGGAPGRLKACSPVHRAIGAKAVSTWTMSWFAQADGDVLGR